MKYLHITSIALPKDYRQTHRLVRHKPPFLERFKIVFIIQSRVTLIVHGCVFSSICTQTYSIIHNGCARMILNTELLMTKAVPGYCDQSIFEPFTRQLNGWEFYRLSSVSQVSTLAAIATGPLCNTPELTGLKTCCSLR